MFLDTTRQFIQDGKAILGLELGSTRIKAVLIDSDHQPIATGSHRWENQLENGVWTYGLREVHTGLAAAYQALADEVNKLYGTAITSLAGIGISAMMHGYLAFDGEGGLLAPFRTWRNTMTLEAAEKLTAAFDFSIPQRWSVAHLYQAILSGEPHVNQIRFLTTLAGYVHWQLTGRKALGVGDASGMFPLDDQGAYDSKRLQQFDDLVKAYKFPWRLADLLPENLPAGQEAGRLSESGAKLLDPSGQLKAGIPFCPPEGDAGTGMVATNAVSARTGNVSAGTSIFAMIVLEKGLSRLHPEIDIVATPDGHPVAMVHCNNCTTDLNAWIDLMEDFQKEMGQKPDRDKLYQVFFDAALRGDSDAGGLVTCGYYSGEHITGFEEGRPFLLQSPDSALTYANLARSVLFSSLATLKIGMAVLEKEKVRIDRILGHGGLYKEGTSGQRFTAAALRTPVSVMETASEGGAWGIAVLAAYMAWRKPRENLGEYLDKKVFEKMGVSEIKPDPEDVKGFETYMARFKAALHVERAAVEHLKERQA